MNLDIQYFNAGGLAIGLLPLGNLLEVPSGRFLGLLPESSHARVLRYRQNADRQRTLFAEALSREMLGKALGLMPGEVDIRRDPGGKPFLAGNPVYFSISHAGEYAACALSNRPCGIDVETQPVSAEIAARFFSAEEAAFSAKERLRRWTLKEALCKCRGLSLEEALRTRTESLPSLGLFVYSKEIPGGWLGAVGEKV